MKVDFESIYRHIGHLFYGLAFNAKNPTVEQVVKLTDLIETIWKPVAGGDAGLHLHLVDCIHDGIRSAIENGMSSGQALSSFNTYYQIHPLPFGQSLKEKIMATVLAIVNEVPHRSSNGFDKEALSQLLNVNAPVL